MTTNNQHERTGSAEHREDYLAFWQPHWRKLPNLNLTEEYLHETYGCTTYAARWLRGILTRLTIIYDCKPSQLSHHFDHKLHGLAKVAAIVQPVLTLPQRNHFDNDEDYLDAMNDRSAAWCFVRKTIGKVDIKTTADEYGLPKNFIVNLIKAALFLKKHDVAIDRILTCEAVNRHILQIARRDLCANPFAQEVT